DRIGMSGQPRQLGAAGNVPDLDLTPAESAIAAADGEEPAVATEFQAADRTVRAGEGVYHLAGPGPPDLYRLVLQGFTRQMPAVRTDGQDGADGCRLAVEVEQGLSGCRVPDAQLGDLPVGRDALADRGEELSVRAERNPPLIARRRHAGDILAGG